MLTVVLSAVSFLVGVAFATLTGWVVPGFVFVGAVGMLWWRPAWGAVFLAFLLGFGRVELFHSNMVVLGEPEQVDLQGTLDEDWGKKDGKWTWLVETERGKFLVKTSVYDDLGLGRVVGLKGRLEGVQDFAKKFSYLHYLQRHRVVGVMENPKLVVFSEGEVSFLGALANVSSFLTERLQRELPEPEASLAVGLLLGKRQQMDEELQEAFQVVGLTHIVAISGSNIAMVVLAFFLFFSFLPFRQRLVCSGVGVALFVLLVGPTAAVLRAGLMGILSLAGLYSGRRSQAFFGLLWSGVLMVVMNPLVLVYDVGFQLSFASTLGILTLTPILERWVPKWPLREAFILTLAAQLMTFPFIVFYFGRFSWVTLIVNLLVAPLIPMAMATSALTLLFGPPAAALASSFLMLIEKIALLSARIPGVQVELTLSPLLFALLLVVFSGFLLLFYKSKLARAFLRGDGAVPSTVLARESETRETPPKLPV